MCAKTQDRPPASLLIPHKALQHPPPRPVCSLACPLAPQYKVTRMSLLLQVAANYYNFKPEEQFGAWFQGMEQLSENER